MEQNRRIIRFESLKNDPWYSRLYPKLKEKDLGIIRSFLIDNEKLSNSDFEFKLNRFFLNNDDKPKNWKYILEFLMISNR